MPYRKNFSAESRNLLQFNGKSDIAHQDRCLEQTFSRQMTSCTKQKLIRRENRLQTTKLTSHIHILFQEGWGYDFRRNMSVSWSDYGKYATDIFTDEAVKAINNHGNTNTTQPLFLYLAHLAVHSANTVQSQIFAYLVSLSKFSIK